MIRLIFIFYIGFLFSNSKLISSVNFEGNNSVENQKLMKVINTQNPKFLFNDIYNIRKLHLDKLNLKNYYMSLGYLEIDVDYLIKENKNNVDVIFKINEGKQYLINEIEIFGNNLLSKDEIEKLLQLKTNQIFNPILLNASLKNIKSIYLEKGKALVNIVDEVYKENQRINIRINISEGKTFNIGSIKIESIDEINNNHIYRELLFSSGDRYNNSQIVKSQKRIYTSNVFSNVEIKKNINKEESLVDLIIKVRKGDSGNIAGEFGFGQTLSALGDDASPITVIQAGGKWNIAKILNTSLKIGVNSNVGIRLDKDIAISTRKFEVSFFSPWLYKFRLPINIKYYFDESSEQGFLRRQGVKTSFLYKQGENYKLNGQLNIENNQISNNNIEQERSLEINYIFYTLNDFLNPRNGQYVSLKWDLRGTLLGGARSYTKVESEYKYFIPIYSYATFAFRAKFGYLYDFSNNNKIEFLPLYDRLYLGGSTSLRGWGEGELNDVGGYLKQLINLEVRIPMFWLIGSEFFIDAGKLINEYTLQTSEFVWNAGYGITFMSPIGPLRIDVAYKYGYGKPTISNALLFIF